MRRMEPTYPDRKINSKSDLTMSTIEMNPSNAQSDPLAKVANADGTSAHMQSRHYDIIIIGSGAGGATIAQRLAKTGKSILILERGEHLPVEPENWSPGAVWLQQRYRTKEQWIDRKGRPFRPNTHYWVGGNTIFYGAALMRLRKNDFEETEHSGGTSPAWPIQYSDLAPYYNEAEHVWQVHGQRGADPSDDPDAPPYDFGPLTHDPSILTLKAAFERRGWKPFPLPLGVQRSDERPWASGCIRCKTCGGHPCLRMAKSDARLVMNKVETEPNVTLLTGRKVLRLEAQGGRSVKEIVCETRGAEERFSGDIVVLAAGAVNSAIILLRSRQARHENGLANSSDQVGRNYMFHTLTATVSMTPAKVDAQFPKTLGLNDFYWKDPEGGFDLPMGHVQLLEYMSGDTIKGQIANKMPAWIVPDGVASMIAKRVLAFLTISEDLPDPANRARLDKQGRIVLEYKHNNLKGHERLRLKLRKELEAAGMICHCLRQHKFNLDELLPLYGTAHQCGTLKMGRDPERSVVDVDCRAHDLDNLYVADSSVFVTSAAVNPTLTIVANAMRVADRIAERLSGRG